MTTQASIIINFHDHPEYCSGLEESCNYLTGGRCALRVVDPKLDSVEKFLSLSPDPEKEFYLKDPSCKFIWEKSQKSQ